MKFEVNVLTLRKTGVVKTTDYFASVEVEKVKNDTNGQKYINLDMSFYKADDENMENKIGQVSVSSAPYKSDFISTSGDREVVDKGFIDAALKLYDAEEANDEEASKL